MEKTFSQFSHSCLSFLPLFVMSVFIMLQVERHFTKLPQTCTNASYLLPGWQSRFRCFYNNFTSLLVFNTASGLQFLFWSSTPLLVFNFTSCLQHCFWSSTSRLVFNFTSGFQLHFWSSTSFLVFHGSPLLW